MNFFGRVPEERQKATQLRFAKMDRNRLQDLWNNVLWTDEFKVDVWP